MRLSFTVEIFYNAKCDVRNLYNPHGIDCDVRMFYNSYDVDYFNARNFIFTILADIFLAYSILMTITTEAIQARHQLMQTHNFKYLLGLP